MIESLPGLYSYLFFFLNQGYRYHKLRKAFSKFYRRHSDLVSKFNVGLKSLCNMAYRNPNRMVT